MRFEHSATGIIILGLYALPQGKREAYAVRQTAGNADKFEGHIAIIEPGRIRSRPLPSQSV